MAGNSIIYTLLLTALILGGFGDLHSQGGAVRSVSGSVLDELKKPIGGATVLLISATDSTYINHTISNANGTFQLKVSTPDTDEAIIKVRSIGYAPLYVRLHPEDTSQMRLVLTAVGQELEEIIVREKAPVKTRGDTILYRGDAFRDSTERKLGELLEKLPGFEVKESGDVTVYGRSIRTMLIDGDNLLDANYQVLTNNLSADVVKDVEVVFNYLDNPLLATVFTSDAVAVNLKTAPQKRRRLNLSVAGAYGTGQRYDADVNLIGLYDRLKTVSFLRSGNVGTPLPPVADPPLPRAEFRVTSLLRPGGSRLMAHDLPLSRDPTRLNNTFFASTIAHLKLKSNWKIRAGMLLPAESFRLLNETTFDYADTMPDAVRRFQSAGTQSMKSYSFTATKDVPDSHRYELKAMLTQRSGQLTTDLSETERYADTTAYRGGSLRALVTKKLGPKMLGVIDAHFLSEREAVHQDIFDVENGVVAWSDYSITERVSSRQVYRPRYAYVSLRLLHALGKGRLIGALGRSAEMRPLLVAHRDINRSTITRSDLFASGRYQLPVSKDLSLTVSSQFGRISGNGAEGNSDNGRPYGNFSASLEQQWHYLKFAKLSIYSGRTLVPVLSAFPQARYRSRYLIEHGSAELFNALSHRHQLTGVFSIGNLLPHRSLTFSSSLALAEEGVLPDFRIIENTAVVNWTAGSRRRDGWTGEVRGEYFIGMLSSTLKGSVGVRQDRYRSLFSGTDGLVVNRRMDLRASLRTGLDLPFNAMVGLDRTQVEFITVQGSFPSVRTVSFVDLLVSVANRFSARFSNTWQTVRASEQRNVNLVANVEVDYRLRGQLSRLSIRVNNVFATDAVTNTQVFDFGRITHRATVLPRFITVGAECSW